MKDRIIIVERQCLKSGLSQVIMRALFIGCVGEINTQEVGRQSRITLPIFLCLLSPFKEFLGQFPIPLICADTLKCTLFGWL